MINQDKVQKEIMIMKKSIAKLVREKDKEFNQIVVLVVAEFKCQNPDCLSEKELQIHHLIMRNSKKYMDFWRYASQRYYWANQIVLCKKCHRKYHKEMGLDVGEDGKCISKSKINEIKKEFEEEE